MRPDTRLDEVAKQRHRRRHPCEVGFRVLDRACGPAPVHEVGGRREHDAREQKRPEDPLGRIEEALPRPQKRFDEDVGACRHGIRGREPARGPAKRSRVSCQADADAVLV